MPNHVVQPAESQALDQFFSQFSSAFQNFAATHNLRIDKYWHAFPSWRFSFKHPKGGLACIGVFKEGESEISVYTYWWLDDYDEGKRFGRTQPSGILPLNTIQMSELLDKTLDMLVAWPMDSWSDTATGFGDSWKQFTKEQFLRLSDDYPTLVYR